MDSVQTLHDFALNLLNDPTALAAFGADPQQALALAGLGDVSAADVHEVIPLVLDYVPVDSLPVSGGLPQLGDLTSVGTDAGGIQGAIEHLTALTQGLGLPAAPGVGDLGGLGGGELPGLGNLTLAGLPGTDALPGVNDITNVGNVTALTGNVTGAFGLGGELAQGLDSQALANLTAAPSYLTDGQTGVVGSTVGQVQQLTVTGGDSHVHQVTELGGSDVHGVTSDFGVSHVLSNVTSGVGDFSGVLKGAGDLDAHHITTEVSHVAHGLGDVTGTVKAVTGISADHNTVGNVGELASGNGAAVHDVVSDVANVSHSTLGNLHLGDIASGDNSIHLLGH